MGERFISRDDAEPANANELVDGNPATKKRPLANISMPSQHGPIRENDVRLQNAIMADMTRSHDKAVIADTGGMFDSRLA